MARPFPNHENHPELQALGEAIRALRLARGLSQEALAVDAGLDRSYLGGVERGQHNVALVNIAKIAEALGLSLEQLMRKAKL